LERRKMENGIPRPKIASKQIDKVKKVVQFSSI